MERIPDVSQRRVNRADVKWQRMPDGRIAIEKGKLGPVRRKALRALGLDDRLTVRLDAIGSKAWELMDGRTVAEVHHALKEAFPGEDDLGPRLGRYLSILVSNDLVRLD